MKKLLVLMLVLGLASVSQAAMCYFYIPGATLVAPGQYEYNGTTGVPVTIQVIADATSGGITELMAVETTSVYSGSVWRGTATTDRDGSTTVLPTTAFGGIGEAGYLENNGTNGVLFDWFTVFDTTGSGLAPGVVLASFSYTVGNTVGGYWVAPLVTGTAYVDLVGDPYVAGASTASLIPGGNTGITGVHIIPEPVSMVLLGLGGLLLRRRK